MRDEDDHQNWFAEDEDGDTAFAVLLAALGAVGTLAVIGAITVIGWMA